MATFCKPGKHRHLYVSRTLNLFFCRPITQSLLFSNLAALYYFCRGNEAVMLTSSTMQIAPGIRIERPMTGQAHIWYTDMTRPDYHLISLLTPDERRLAERYIFKHDRANYITRRAVLRMLLGQYLGREPQSLLIEYSVKGKPELVAVNAGPELRFNLSHSGDKVVYAFTSGQEIGIDIEKQREIPNMEQIFARFFSKRENETFLSLPEAFRQEAFFNCWTRKEAFVKATGEGLSFPLDSFDVSIQPGQTAELIAIRGYLDEASQWFMQELSVAPGYMAALALRGHCDDVLVREWTGLYKPRY